MPNWKETVEGRYAIKYDKDKGCFFILDCWNEQVKNLPLDAEIPEDSSAVKTLSSMEVNALVGELIKLGWLDKMKIVGEDKQITKEMKDIREVAIESIFNVASQDIAEGVAREAILAIREIAR